MPPIKLPPTPASAYNEQRPANALLISQVRMLERAVRDAGRPVVSARPKTEGQVAAWIRELNRALHKQVLLPVMKRRPLRASRAVGKSSGSHAASKPARKAHPVKKARSVKKARPVKKASRPRAARKQGRKR